MVIEQWNEIALEPIHNSSSLSWKSCLGKILTVVPPYLYRSALPSKLLVIYQTLNSAKATTIFVFTRIHILILAPPYTSVRIERKMITSSSSLRISVILMQMCGICIKCWDALSSSSLQPINDKSRTNFGIVWGLTLLESFLLPQNENIQLNEECNCLVNGCSYSKLNWIFHCDFSTFCSSGTSGTWKRRSSMCVTLWNFCKWNRLEKCWRRGGNQRHEEVEKRISLLILLCVGLPVSKWISN